MAEEKKAVGSANQGDCQVVVLPTGPLRIEVNTKNPTLLERGVREVVSQTVTGAGIGRGTITVSEEGALDYVIAARVETALRSAFPEEASPIQLEARRAPTERDRPRRSRLYAPGNNPRFLVGVDLHGADCVLLDLEDSVPPSEKAAARVLVKHLLSAIAIPEVWVRINPLNTYGKEDLVEVMQGRPHGICLPKAESENDVKNLAALLSRMEKRLGLIEGTTWIMPIIESARGVLYAERIAADPRVVMIAFGAEDFTRDVGALRTPESLLFARSMIVVAARAAGIQASDTVYANLEDEQGLLAEAKMARALGFDGKGAINPRQIPLIHAAFSPSEAEIEEARRIVKAAEDAAAQGIGAIAVDGKMVDRPVLERAKRTLKLAESLVGRIRA
jgi:citrate lyase subunit beta/citryl-CoA lyase